MNVDILAVGQQHASQNHTYHELHELYKKEEQCLHEKPSTENKVEQTAKARVESN